MTQRELEKLLKDTTVQKEMEQGLLGDPGLWLTEEEVTNLDAGRLERRITELKAESKRSVLARLAAEDSGLQPSKRLIWLRPSYRLRPAAIIAICVLIIAAFFTLVPAGRTMATSFLNMVVRKVTGHIVIENVGEVPPNVVKSVKTKISGVDGYRVDSFMDFGEMMEKTDFDPVILTSGYESILTIVGETEPGWGYELVVTYVLPGEDRYITTTQHWEGDMDIEILANSYTRTVLGGTEIHCGVTDDDAYTIGVARLSSSRFGVVAPKELSLDALLQDLALGSQIDARQFVVTLPEPTESTQETITYNSVEEFSAENGLWPVVLNSDFARLETVEFYPSEFAGDLVSLQYAVEGGKVWLLQRWGYVDGMVATMEDTTYFETTILGGYTLHGSVDAIDGVTSGIAVVDESVLMLSAEKGVDYTAVLNSLAFTTPEQ